jgi:hypothetical protein
MGFRCLIETILFGGGFPGIRNMSTRGLVPWGSKAHVVAPTPGCFLGGSRKLIRQPLGRTNRVTFGSLIGPAVQGLGGTNPAPHGHWEAPNAEPTRAFCCVVPCCGLCVLCCAVLCCVARVRRECGSDCLRLWGVAPLCLLRVGIAFLRRFAQTWWGGTICRQLPRFVDRTHRPGRLTRETAPKQVNANISDCLHQ